MFRPIIEKESIIINNLFFFIKASITKNMRLIIFSMILFNLYYFLSGPTYNSNVTFYSNYEDESMLNIFTPSNLLDNKRHNLKFEISEFLESELFLERIVKKEYDYEGNKITLVDLWGGRYNEFLVLNPLSLVRKMNLNIMFIDGISEYEKKLFFAKRFLFDSIESKEFAISSLHSITVNVEESPNLAKQISDEIYNSIVSYSQEIAKQKTAEKVVFIEERLKEIDKDLKKSEDKLIEFLYNNKIINSPQLKIEEKRLERDVAVNNQLFLSLSEQFELTKIEQKDNSYPIFTLDKSNVSSVRSGIDYVPMNLVILFLLITSFAIKDFLNNRKILVVE